MSSAAWRWMPIAVGAVLLAVFGASLPRAARAESSGDYVTLAVVVAGGSRVTKVSREQLKRAFTSQPVTGPDGQRLVPLNHPPRTPDRVGFDQTVLGMGPDEVGRFWIDRRIRGQAAPPRTVEDLATLRRLVERLPGAVAYLRPGQLSGNLKALAIDGKLPNDVGYPIVYRR